MVGVRSRTFPLLHPWATFQLGMFEVKLHYVHFAWEELDQERRQLLNNVPLSSKEVSGIITTMQGAMSLPGNTWKCVFLPGAHSQGKGTWRELGEGNGWESWPLQDANFKSAPGWHFLYSAPTLLCAIFKLHITVSPLLYLYIYIYASSIRLWTPGDRTCSFF